MRPGLSTFLGGAIAASLLLSTGGASAQEAPLSESIVIGAWTFRPSVELRLRGEARKNPATYGSNSIAVLRDTYQGKAPITYLSVPTGIGTLWSASERTRLGMTVDRGPITGAVVLQDSRVLGDVPGSVGLGALGGQGTGAYGLSLREAYIDIHSQSGKPMFLRVGRQRVVWGDGRLVGENDWSPFPRALDAARFGIKVSDFDFEVMGVLLTAPFTQLVSGPSSGSGSNAAAEQSKSWIGSQLYGFNAKWHLLPLLNPELTALARVSRLPETFAGVGNDTVALSARFSGDHRGFRYSAEGVYELGRVASYGVNRDISAFAAAARASLETALPGHLTFGVQGALASGDNGTSDPNTVQTRFDPLLPDAFANHGAMGLYAWSNLLEAGGDVEIKPLDVLSVRASYRFAALADPNGRWTTGSLEAIGASNENSSRALGHELDATVTLKPWEPIEIRAGYGLFLFGDKAKAILSRANQKEGAQHWGYLQALVRAP